jgi:hypothetical protein
MLPGLTVLEAGQEVQSLAHMHLLLLLSHSVLTLNDLVHKQDVMFIVCNEPDPVAAMVLFHST